MVKSQWNIYYTLPLPHHFLAALVRWKVIRWLEYKHIGLGTDVRTCFAQQLAPTVDRCNTAQVTIDMLPDVALLRIFDFYIMNEDRIEAWHTLVHVCREWRIVIFGSPRRLDLQLLCKVNSSIRIREKLDGWPLFPIVVWADGYETWRADNIIAALEHKDRVRQLRFLELSSWLLETVLAKLWQSFPALTHLELQSEDETILADHDSFLGGSAPSLRSLLLDYVPFPGLPKLLLSTIHLADLRLRNISHSGYISSEAMVTTLSTLTRLERLWL